MADGWRNRFMAPVYALVISFGLVFIVEFAMDDSTRIRFEVAGQGEPAEAFPDLNVQVNTVAGERLDDVQLGGSQEFTLLNPQERIQICTTLPAGWSSKDAVVNGTSRCWVRSPPGKDVVITLDRPVG